MTITTDKKPFDYKAFNAFKKTPKYWGRFDIGNSKHKYILSLLRQMDWITMNKQTGRSYADLERLGEWLQSTRSPVRKPLCQMDKIAPADPKQSELSRTITALEAMVQKHHSKK